MKVVTSYPIYINKTKISKPSEYLSIDGTNPGQVKMFQNYANKKHNAGLAVDGKYGTKTASAYDKWGAEFEQGAANIMNAISTATQSVPSGSANEPRPNKGTKLKNAFQKAKDLGLIDIIKNKAGLSTAPSSTSTDTPTANTDIQPDAPQGMSTKMKVMIGAGAALVVITIIYFATKKNK